MSMITDCLAVSIESLIVVYDKFIAIILPQTLCKHFEFGVQLESGFHLLEVFGDFTP